MDKIHKNIVINNGLFHDGTTEEELNIIKTLT